MTNPEPLEGEARVDEREDLTQALAWVEMERDHARLAAATPAPQSPEGRRYRSRMKAKATDLDRLLTFVRVPAPPKLNQKDMEVLRLYAKEGREILWRESRPSTRDALSRLLNLLQPEQATEESR